MAIHHVNASIVKRSAGQSAVAAAAYRAGERLIDERTGETHDYRPRQKRTDDTAEETAASLAKAINYSQILAPTNAPAWARDRGQLWNRVEAREKLPNSQVAREMRVAIPSELSVKAGRRLVRRYAKDQFTSRGMVADIAWHGEGGPNPHAHILLTMRPISGRGFGNKERSWNSKDTLKEWRKAWADTANQFCDLTAFP